MRRRPTMPHGKGVLIDSGRSQVIRPLRAIVPQAVHGRVALWLIARARRKYAYRYLSGEGLELGAMHRPLAVPPGAGCGTWTT
jgi:hypothetical protein